MHKVTVVDLYKVKIDDIARGSIWIDDSKLLTDWDHIKRMQMLLDLGRRDYGVPDDRTINILHEGDVTDARKCLDRLLESHANLFRVRMQVCYKADGFEDVHVECGVRSMHSHYLFVTVYCSLAVGNARECCEELIHESFQGIEGYTFYTVVHSDVNASYGCTVTTHFECYNIDDGVSC